MIDRSFIEKIEEMTGPKTVDTVFGTYSDKRLYRIEDKLVDTISLSSLSGLATMIKQEMNDFNIPLFVRVSSPEKVDVLGAVRDDMQREMPYTAIAKFIGFDYDRYMSIENMIICLKSRFAPTISTHTLRGERDRKTLYIFDEIYNFNSHAPWGA